MVCGFPGAEEISVCSLLHSREAGAVGLEMRIMKTSVGTGLNSTKKKYVRPNTISSDRSEKFIFAMF